ncbi:diaminopimelate decarboxylase family protein [Streptomyces gelaticus]|uniref:diaminopimelate decarboxylase family protein n=1 Tax=Streptomyces gelaticus TaxID=285446 RepID=UPI0037B9A1E8
MVKSLSAEPLQGLRRTEISQIGTLLPYLGYESGDLAVNGVPVRELWPGRHPLIIFLPERAADNYRALHEAFSEHFNVSIHYALKSCYMPAVVRALRKAGAGIEVMSRFEWELADRYGFTADTVLANAVRRDERLRSDLLQADVKAVGVDGIEELDAVCETARRLDLQVRVSIRVNPLDCDSFFSQDTKLGTNADDVGHLLETALKSPYVSTVGIHAHQLRKCAGPDLFGKQARAVGELVTAVSTGRRRVDMVNLGGGLESRFQMERSGVSCADFAQAARDALQNLPPETELVLEPGRFLVSDAAIALTGVLGPKQANDIRWLVTEIGTNTLSPYADRSYQPLPLTLADEGDELWGSYHITDPLAVSNVFCPDAELPRSVEDSALALLDCGAYSSVYAQLWGCALPDLAVMENGRLRSAFDASSRESMRESMYGGESGA